MKNLNSSNSLPVICSCRDCGYRVDYRPDFDLHHLCSHKLFQMKPRYIASHEDDKNLGSPPDWCPLRVKVEIFFVGIYKDECDVARYMQISQSSGGYPYSVEHLWQAKFFHRKQDIVDYLKLFPEIEVLEIKMYSDSSGGK
jgi:hypothetical protein